MLIRDERPEDIAAIRAVTDTAFQNAPHSNQAESRIVDALRHAGTLSVSLVAIDGQALIGHVAFSPVRISDGSADWYGLGPVSIEPARQCEGIGSVLIREGLARLETLGARGCVVLGEPVYYRRFGFVTDPSLRYPGVPPAYFQRLVLRGPPPQGDVAYDPAFAIT